MSSVDSSSVSPVVEALDTCGVPAKYLRFGVRTEDCKKLAEHDLGNKSKVWVCEDGSRPDRKLVFKLVSDDKKYARDFFRIVNSLMPLRSFFLAPVRAFSKSPPYGVFYDFYPDAKPISKRMETRGMKSRSQIAGMICRAMATLESVGLVHGALNSDNILVDSQNIPIITDAGLCRPYAYFRGEKGKRKSGVSWIAPEILLGGPPNYTVDVYAFGVLLYELSEGKRPYADMTNLQYLVALRYEMLEPLKFVDTLPRVKKTIEECMNRDPKLRPSFSDLYEAFAAGEMILPGDRDRATITESLAPYPFRQREITKEPRFGDVKKRGMQSPEKLLNDPSSPKFGEYLDFLELVIVPEMFISLCNALEKHGPTESVSTTKMLERICVIACRDKEFLRSAVTSKFFLETRLGTSERGDFVLNVVGHVLAFYPDMFDTQLYYVTVQLFLLRPKAMLNLLSNYVINVDFRDPKVLRNMNMFIGLAPLFVDSTRGKLYLRIMKYVMKRSPNVRSKFERLMPAFVESADKATSQFAGTRSSNKKVAEAIIKGIIGAPTEWKRISSKMLVAATMDPCLAAVPTMLRQARLSDTYGLQVLLKYVGCGCEQAATLLSDCSWMEYDLPDVKGTFRLFLAIMAHKNSELRERLFQACQCPILFRRVCSEHDDDFPIDDRLHYICLIISGTTLTKEFMANASRARFIGEYLWKTLRSTASDDLIKYGLRVLDRMLPVGYAVEYVSVTEYLRTLALSNKESIKVHVLRRMAQMSVYPQCMQAMEMPAICECFTQLAADPSTKHLADGFFQNLKSRNPTGQ